MKRARPAFLAVLGANLVLLAGLAWYFWPAPAPRSPAATRARVPRPPRTLPPVRMGAWRPGSSLPGPRELLRNGDWERRFGGASNLVRALNPEAWTGPVFSLRITEVGPGSQAGRLGIRVGDRLTEFEGEPILGVAAFSARRADHPGMLGAWSESGGRRSFGIPAGRLGIAFEEDWRPDVAHARSADRDPKWDALVFAACAVRGSDPELAETALHRAAKAGYGGWLLPALMAVIAHEQLRHDEALDYAWAARTRAGRETPKPVLAALLQSAVLAGGAEAILGLKKDLEPWSLPPESWDLESIAARIRDAKPRDPGAPSPAAFAAAGGGEARPLEGLEPNSKYLQGDLARGAASALEFAPPSGVVVFLGPRLRNPAFSFDFDIDLQGSGNPDFPASLQFSLLDAADHRDETLVHLELRPEGLLTIQGAGYPSIPFKVSGLLMAGNNVVDLALLGPWCEVRVNGRCAFAGPVPHNPGREVVLGLGIWNVRGFINGVEARELDPAAPAALHAKPSAPAESVTPGEPESPSLAWHHEAAVGAYLRVGSRSSAWDEASVAALRRGARLLKNPEDLTDIGAIHSQALRAASAGCDDPLVLALLDRSHRTMRGEPHPVHTPAFRSAALSAKARRYPPAVQLWMLAQSGWDHHSTTLARFTGSIERLVDTALALLPAVVADPAVPTRMKSRTLMDLLSLMPGVEKDPIAAYERIQKAAESGPARSAAAFAFRGSFFITFAWKARGGGWAKTVTPEGWRLFRERLAAAAQALEAAWKMDETDPTVPALMIQAALGEDTVREQLEAWWRRARAAEPDCIEAARGMLWLLTPRWHGSREAAPEWARTLSAEVIAGDLSPSMAVLLLEAHERLVEPGSWGDRTPQEERSLAAAHWKRSEVWAGLQPVFQWALKKRPDSVYLRSRFACAAARCGRWEEARAEFDALGDSLCVSAFGGRDAALELRAASRAMTRRR